MSGELLSDEYLSQFVDQAAIEWCGEKQRETFSGDIAYFCHNWRAFPGFRVRVEALAYRAWNTRTPTKAPDHG